jgi:hypothetical protein
MKDSPVEVPKDFKGHDDAAKGLVAEAYDKAGAGCPGGSKTSFGGGDVEKHIGSGPVIDFGKDDKKLDFKPEEPGQSGGKIAQMEVGHKPEH